MRNGDTLPFAMQLIQTVQTFPMYLFHEVHTNLEHIAVPHPPQCAHWGTFPPGEGIALRYLYKFQFIEPLGKNRYAHFLFPWKTTPGVLSLPLDYGILKTELWLWTFTGAVPKLPQDFTKRKGYPYEKIIKTGSGRSGCGPLPL